MNILFIITARGGSKGVHRKNLAKVGEHPLIWYKIDAAKKCLWDKRIIVSTDDDEISKLSLEYGAEVPFVRPDYLSTDSADSIDVVMHAVEWVDNHSNSKFDYICLLEPSSPFLPGKWLNEAIDLINKSNADTVLSMKRVNVNRVFINTLDSKGGLSNFYTEIVNLRSTRRQDQQEEYTMNGCLYLAKYDYFKNNRTFHSQNSLPYIMPEEYSIEIDSKHDLEFARFLVKEKKIDLSFWG